MRENKQVNVTCCSTESLPDIFREYSAELLQVKDVEERYFFLYESVEV